ncbi:MAG: xanthine dehydrogenase family protein subunit M [Deltaproteobacteria bacterium]|nr:xanthine dehydrogenase family protein subunit M [Deltaproteobacteria bacterium]
MINYEYFKPESLDEVFELMQQYGSRAALVAGGTDVMVFIKQSNHSPEVLISLRGLTDLSYIRKNEGYHIGALATHRMLEQSKMVKNDLTALHQGASQVGSVQVRNVGTLGGNICNAAPSADTAGPLLILDAVMVLQSPEGQRRVPIEQFFIGPSETVKKDDEVLVEIEIPAEMSRFKTAYCKHARRQAMNLPIIGVSVGVLLEGDVIADSRIALTVVAPTPIRVPQVEAFLKGKPFEEAVLNEAGEIASSPECCMPRDSVRCEGWYREEMVRVLIPRVARAALGP